MIHFRIARGKEGALADMILVDGNPLEKLDLVADLAKNFVVIMKDGKSYENKTDETRMEAK